VNMVGYNKLTHISLKKHKRDNKFTIKTKNKSTKKIKCSICRKKGHNKRGENLREKYIGILKENSEYLQKNINLLNVNNALKSDKDDLIKENKELKEQIETEMDKLNKEIEKLKKTNDAFKVLLQEMQDENSYYKNSENSNSYDSGLYEEISIRLDELEKQIATLSGINHEQIIENSKKIFKHINHELGQKEKTINFLRNENYDLQGLVNFYKNCLYKELIETISSFFDKLLDDSFDYLLNISVIQDILGCYLSGIGVLGVDKDFSY
ncbi:11354_t:CDS:2, partial [Scutellospora calospora]